MMLRGVIISLVLSVIVVIGSSSVFAHEDENISEEINALNAEIARKQQSVDQLHRQIESYRLKIEEKQAQEATLYGEIDLLENRIAKTELDIEATEAQMDLVQVEIVVIEHELHELERAMIQQREMMTKILQEIQVDDNRLPLQLIFGSSSFSEFFSGLEQLKIVSDDLNHALDAARKMQDQLRLTRETEQAKKDQLEGLRTSLVTEQRQLESTIGAKALILETTQQSEAQFQQLLKDVKSEQAYLNQQVAYLQKEIEGKLTASDEVGDTTLLSWPVNPTTRGISAYFHDPTYPFRHLFEHSGIDLPAPTGTPVLAPASGYVAWTRKGTLYGNYIMIIHANGLATLYAHLSRIDVTPDQFVARGEQIGAVGNTGLSTGPHLHFEVRKNGLPTNPMNYLMSY